MTRVLALADQSKIGCITQRRFAKVGPKPHPHGGPALDRNGLSVSTETACRFEPKSPAGNSEICTRVTTRQSGPLHESLQNPNREANPIKESCDWSVPAFSALKDLIEHDVPEGDH